MTANPLQEWPVPQPGERPVITPGPWGIAPETNGTEMVAYSANPWRVRAVLVRGDFSGNPNWRADTKAMAATPQLVEALTYIVRRAKQHLDDTPEDDRRDKRHVLARAEAALKAAGIEP